MDLTDLTWECHVCGDERPDQFISVYKGKDILPSGVMIDINVRYCNDRPSCVRGASSVSFLKQSRFKGFRKFWKKVGTKVLVKVISVLILAVIAAPFIDFKFTI